MGGTRFGRARLAEARMGGPRRLPAGVPAAKSFGCLVALLVAILALVPASASAESLCTDTWTGPSEGNWTTAEDWSASKVPTSTDVACVGSGKAVDVTSGANQAGVVQGAGTLAISGGSLELASGLEVSTIASLKQTGGTLTGAGTLDITSSFSAVEGHMSGSGSTVLESGASGVVEVPSETDRLFLEGRSFLNEGTLTFASGTLELSEGAQLKNTGTFKANSETLYRFCEICITSGSKSAPSIVNTGTFEKTAGTGSSQVEVSVENQGSVQAQKGQLTFSGGGSDTTGAWSASEGAAINFQEGSFSLAGGSWSGVVNVRKSTSVAVEGVAASTAQVTITSSGTLSIPKGSITVRNLTLTESGTLTGAGTLNISSSLSWVGTGTMSGSGTTVLSPGATGAVEVSNVNDRQFLTGRSLVSEGTLTFASGTLELSEGAQLKNTGTFKANSETLYRFCEICITSGSKSAPSIVNTGTFEKTAGTGSLQVEVSVENQGSVQAQKGQLTFSGGGSDTTGAWSASEGAAINFQEGSFSLTGGSWSGVVNVRKSTSVAVEGVAASTAQVTITSSGSLSVAEGSVTVNSLTLTENGTLSGAGTLNISTSLSWLEAGTMSGSGATVLKPGATGTVEVSSVYSRQFIIERSLVNEGTLTFASGTFEMSEGAQLKNYGTFKANSETLYKFCQICVVTGAVAPKITNAGTFEKTAGAGTTEIEVNFENLGSLAESSGRLIIKHPVAVEQSTSYGGAENPSAPGQPHASCGDPVSCATGNYSRDPD